MAPTEENNRKDPERDWLASKERIENALANAGKRNALAEQLGIVEGQLSKMINGSLPSFCQLIDLLGLEIRKKEYVHALEQIVKEKL